MIKCNFCGITFDESEGKSSCSSCPMNKVCKKAKCPNCGFEIPKEPALIKFMKKKWGKRDV